MDYFTRMLNASPFSHLWFLGVLLQYYLLWPLLLGVIFYVQRHFGWDGSVVWLIILVLIASLWMPLLYYYQSDITKLYYGTDTRIFALLLGGVLGMVAHELFMKQISSGREDVCFWLKYIMAIILLVSVEMIYFLLDGNNKWVSNCFIDAKASRYVGGGVDVVKNMLAQKRLGEIVVIHLGTNGPIAGWEQYEVQTKELVKLLGDKR